MIFGNDSLTTVKANGVKLQFVHLYQCGMRAKLTEIQISINITYIYTVPCVSIAVWLWLVALFVPLAHFIIVHFTFPTNSFGHTRPFTEKLN